MSRVPICTIAAYASNPAWSPDSGWIVFARGLLAAAAEAEAAGAGVVSYRDMMVDAPMIERARRMLAMAEET